MNIVISAYLDGVIVCLIALGILYGYALGHEDERSDVDTLKELTLFSLGWPAWMCGGIAYYVAKLFQTRNSYR